jgi:hypothetical protein
MRLLWGWDRALQIHDPRALRRRREERGAPWKWSGENLQEVTQGFGVCAVPDQWAVAKDFGEASSGSCV